ncbi:MAG: hypothetical protein GY906_01445 [bacterium]|nr:hypothetical protein [bacterium]
MQRKTTLLNLTVAIIVLTSWTSAAQGPDRRGGQRHRPPTPAVDTALDADGDEVISADEISNAASALIELDADNDGKLSFSECMGFSTDGRSRQAPPTRRGGSGGQPPAPPIVSALDTSGDEVVDGNEIADAPMALLELDENADGVLQADEYRPPHPGGQMDGGPPRNR